MVIKRIKPFILQLRAGRNFVHMGIIELSKRSGVSQNAINRIEKGHADYRSSTEDRLTEVMEKQGVRFLRAGDTVSVDCIAVEYNTKTPHRKPLED